MQYIDLSVVINEQTPAYPGDPAPQIKPVLTLDKDGCNDHIVTITTHLGTHMDAPLHMLAGGKTLDTYSIDHFIGPGRLIKVDKAITLELVQTAGIRPGEIVLFWTGMGTHYMDPAYFEDYPAMPEAVATYLVEQQVKMVGLDTCSPDHEAFVAHRMLLKNDILIIENLTNLEKLAGKEFTIYALPIKLQVDGAPARVFATVEE